MRFNFFLMVVALTLLCVSLRAAGEDGVKRGLGDESGKCGDNVFWSYDKSTKTLKISGTGDMMNYTSFNEVPWMIFSYSLTTVVFEGTVTSIGDHAFDGCYLMSSITLPSTITYIGSSAFSGCSGLTAIVIPASVKTISQSGMFTRCMSLNTITVEEGNSNYKDIDGVLFNGTGQTILVYPPGRHGDYVIPNVVKTIGSCAFLYCDHLTSVIIPDSVTEIVGYAFQHSPQLKTVTVPASVLTIGDAPFVSCKNLTWIEVNPSNPNYKSLDGVLLTADGTVLIQYPAGKKGGYTFPESVTRIGWCAFQGAEELTSLTIPSSLNSVSISAFDQCTKLEVVSYLSSSAPSYGPTVFNGCTNLRAVCVPLNFESTDFCGFTKSFCKNDACAELPNSVNHCFEAVCENDVLHSVKRVNATEWEKKSNGCVEYQCDNNTGPVATSKCAGSGNVCVNNECASSQLYGWIVNITVEVGDDELNTFELTEMICNLTGLKLEELTVSVKMDDDGKILNVIVKVDDEKTAQKVFDSIDGINKGGSCPYGVLCRTKSIKILKIVEGNSFLSGSSRTSESIIICILAVMALWSNFK